MANSELAQEVINAVKSYVANHEAGATPKPLDDLNLLKWTNNGHLVVDKATNKELAKKVSDVTMAERESSTAATNSQSATNNPAAEPVDDKFADNIRQQLASKKQNVPSEGDSATDTPKISPKEEAKVKPVTKANTPPREAPPRPDPKLTPYKKFTNKTEELQSSYIAGYPSYELKSGVAPQMREIIDNPKLSSAEMHEELKQFSKPLNEAKLMKNTNPLPYNFLLVNTAWLNYVDSLGHFAGTPPIDAAVNETYANLQDLNVKVNELNTLNQENPGLQQYPATLQDTSSLDKPDAPWPDRILAKDTTASAPSEGGGEGSPWPDRIFAKDTIASAPSESGGDAAAGQYEVLAKSTRAGGAGGAKNPVDSETASLVQLKTAEANDSLAKFQASGAKVDQIDQENGFSAQVTEQRNTAANLANEYNQTKRKNLPTDDVEKKITEFRTNVNSQMNQSKSGSVVSNIGQSLNNGSVTPAVLSGVASNLAFNQMMGNLAVSNNFDAQLLTANNPVVKNSQLLTDAQNKVITKVPNPEDIQGKAQGGMDGLQNKAQGGIDGQLPNGGLDSLDPQKLASDKLGLDGLDPNAVQGKLQDKLQVSQDDIPLIKQQQKAKAFFDQAANYSSASTLLPMASSLAGVDPTQIQYPPELIDFTEKLTTLQNSTDDLNNYVGGQSAALGDKVANNEQVNSLVDGVNNSYADADQSLDALIAKRDSMIAQSPLNNAANLDKLNFAASNLDAVKSNPLFGALCGAAGLGALAAFEMPQLASMISDAAPDIMNPLSGVSMPSMPSFEGGVPSMPSMPSFNNGLGLQMTKLQEVEGAIPSAPPFEENDEDDEGEDYNSKGISYVRGKMPAEVEGAIPSAPPFRYGEDDEEEGENDEGHISKGMSYARGKMPAEVEGAIPSAPPFGGGGSGIPTSMSEVVSPLDGMAGLSMMDTGALTGGMAALSTFSAPTLGGMMGGISMPAMPAINADMGAMKDKFASLTSMDGMVDSSALTGPLFAMRDMVITCPLLLLPILDFQFALSELTLDIELDAPEPETPEVGAQQYGASEAGMLQCMMGISPGPYMVAPTGETFTPGLTMGSILSPTMFPTHGGCNLPSNPLAAAQLFIPPYQCIANLHAPFVPGDPQCMVMHGSSPALVMNDICTCLYAAGGQIMLQMPGQFQASKG